MRAKQARKASSGCYRISSHYIAESILDIHSLFLGRCSIAYMSTRPKSASNTGADAEARAAKRAEIERKVAEGRAKLQLEKDIKEAAEREKLKAEQEKEARKQAQLREALMQAMKEKDEVLARQLAQREEQQQRSMQEHQSFLVQLRLKPLEKVKESKVFLCLDSHLLTGTISNAFDAGCGS